MSAYNNNFMRKGNSEIPPLSPFVVIHEDPVQTIQGGAPNDHYHLTAAQVASVNEVPALVAGQFIYREPMMIGGNLVTVLGGDLLMGDT